MNYEPKLSLEEVQYLVQSILDTREEKLEEPMMLVLRASYDDITYSKAVEKESPYETDYLNSTTAPKLFSILTEELGKKVSKKNCIKCLEEYYEQGSSQNHIPRVINIPKSLGLLKPDFYIKRRNVESKCYQIITEPTEQIRIRGPQKMGKTLLLENLLDYARQQGYQTAKLDLQAADSNTFTDLNTFLKWLCVKFSEQLDEVFDCSVIQSKVEEYWRDITVPKTNCEKYFQQYLLSNTENTLVLAIDNLEKLFKYSDIFLGFAPLLRSWNEETKSADRVGKIWRKLRVVLVYSTEIYPELDTNHSPFNVGETIDLLDFKLSEIEELTRLHGLDTQLGENELRRLMELVGGHPYFIQLAFTNLKNQQMTLEELLSLAPTQQGIYSHFLRRQLRILQHNPPLELAYREVVMTNDPVKLDTEVAFKLHSMGLTKFKRNDCIPYCNLYRQYFSEYWG